LTKAKYLSAMAIFTALIIVGVTVNAQPGTPADPMVSRSYVNARVGELEAQIAQLNAAINSIAPGTHTIESPIVSRELFTVVRADANTVLIGGASTEIILRSGQATAVAGPNGLANVTAGFDLMNGQAVPLNNLLIVPQADGRGMRFHTTAYLMVKGDFHIIQE